MPSELIVLGALANCGQDAPTDDFLEMLIRETPDLAAFRFRPKPRAGWGVKASLDWQAVLGTGADILAFATVLWAAFERYVRPRLQRGGPSQPFLFIQLKRHDGDSVQFAIGRDEFKDKEVFIEQFTREVKELRASGDALGGAGALSELSRSEEWVRIRVRDRKESE